MYNIEKSLGMCSDRPGTTPKNLDLVVLPTCLREKERESFWRFGTGWWGKRKGTLLYKSILADPTAMRRSGLSATLRADRPPLKNLI